MGGALVGNDGPTTVEAGATLDLGGFGLDVNDLLGAGTVTDSGAAATLTLDAANFSGAISGPLSLAFYGDASLSGLEDTTGGATLNGSVTVANAGTYDIVANANISGTPASLFINNGLFEKTGGGGVSDVTTNFVNGGTLNVLSGSVQFSGGFTNNGVIHGLVTESGGVTTVSAAVPSDFNGDGLSDILWQNTDGTAAIWEMDGATPISQQTVGANPGPSWQAVGTGDFNGDGDSDILFQNTDGQVAIWEMNGTTPIDQQLVGANPGPSWQAIGTGDFNGDGDSDILFQNTDGQVAIWEMNGTTPIDQQTVGANPGPSWQTIGTGDFNGDGDSDILFQNTNGQVAIWEMNGTTPIAQAALSLNPGPSWKAIGTGDYYGDGHSDILFQNTTSGQAAIWEMNGLTPISQDLVSSVPGADWQATSRDKSLSTTPHVSPLVVGAHASNVANLEKVLRDGRRPGRVAPESRAPSGWARRFSRRGARMRFVFLIGTLAATLSGCASYRDVSFIYYPNAPHRDTFPSRSEFYAVAQQECAKYGMRATYNWSNYFPDFERVRVNYLCVQ